MDSKSASKKLQAAAEQGAVIKFSMPAGPESDEFYSNLVRKFGPDVVSRTVKENCSAMSPRSRTPTQESVCSSPRIESVNENFNQQLTATLKQDIDWNFIDFIIDYLLSSDKDGPQEADVDKLIQNYVKLNPQLREQLVAMLKNLAEGKEIRIEPSQDTAVVPKRSTRVRTDEVSVTASSPKLPSSSRSPKRPMPNPNKTASKTLSCSDVMEKSATELPIRFGDNESPNSSTLSSPKVKATPESAEDRQDSTPKSAPKLPLSPTPSPSPRAAQPRPEVGCMRVVGATSKAMQLLRAEDNCVDGIALISTTPSRIDDSDCDEVFQFAGCTYDELMRLESAGFSTKKKKKRNKKRNKKKNNASAEGESAVDLSASATVSAQDAASEAEAAMLKTAEEDCEGAGAIDKQKGGHQLSRTPKVEELSFGAAENPSTSSGDASAVLAIAEPLRLVNDIESRAPMGLARTDILLERDFKFQSVSQAECSVVTSWEELKELVAEVFPNDSELQEAFATKAHNSLDLWKFIVKYGRMYKDFVSEVLEMVNELKKGLIDAMDMHREKTNDILETHKKEMCSVVEKARAADYRIEILEKELEDHRLSADDQKVKAFTQEEEIQKLQKDLTAKDKRLRDFENTKRELLSARNKAKEEKDRIAVEHEKTKSDLLRSETDCKSLHSRLRRAHEGAEEAEYKLRELDGKLHDEQAETGKLRDSNTKLMKKNEALLKEIERLKEKAARQRVLETTNMASTVHPPNIVPTADGLRVPPTRPVSSNATSPSRGSFFSSVLSPLPGRPTNPQYHPSLNSASYFSSPARVVGSPSSQMLPQINSQPSAMRPHPFSSTESSGSQVLSRVSYAAASARNPTAAFGQTLSQRDSALGKQQGGRDTEVHSLLSPGESAVKYRNDFSSSNVAGNGSRPMFDDAASRVVGGIRTSRADTADCPVAASLPSFASLFSRDEAPAQPEVPYSPWGNPNYDFSSPATAVLFNIKPSSLTATPSEYQMDLSPRYPGSDPSTTSEATNQAPDQNATNRNQGFPDLFRF